MSINNLDSTGFNLILNEVKKEILESKQRIKVELDSKYLGL